MNNIYNYTLEELENYFVNNGDKKFRATQIFEWLYRKRVNSFEEMTNLNEKTINHLKENFELNLLKLSKLEISNDGTRKYLFELNDNNFIETVLMKHPYGYSICITSQVGCNMGCAFCASGELKKIRNLEVQEMILQVLYVQKELDKENLRITNIVVMGIGEPFDNYDNLTKFLRVVNYPKGLEIGARHITVSTCGLIPKIKEFAKFELQINLAVSLHAPTDEKRSALMKINNTYPLEDLMMALKEYLSITNRRITFEYILLKGINDSIADANQLSNLIRGINCYVNLIPYNEVSTKPYKKTPNKDAQAFFEVLRKRGINATLRVEHGSDISAACGQLRAKKMKGE